MAEASASDNSSAGSEYAFGTICQPCSSDSKLVEAEQYCNYCQQHLCAQCVGFHKKLFFRSKDHLLVGSADFNEQITATFVADIEVTSDFLPRFSSNINSITGLVLASVERLVAADGDNNRIMFVDTTKKKVISEFKTEGHPWDVTVCGGEVVATLPIYRTIKFLKCDDGFVNVSARHLRVDGEWYGIDCVDDKLYVAYGKEKKLEVMTATGAVLQRFDKSDQGDNLFNSPRYVTVNTVNQSIYVSGRTYGQLTVLGMDGKMRARRNDGRLVWFYQLAVDTTGAMYLCDYNNNTIHLLSPLCGTVKILLTAQDGLHMPASVCFCESTRRLYIGMVNHKIKIYQIS